MLSYMFRTVLGMSVSGAAVILAVLLARLALRRAPRVFSYALWAIVLVRLLVPFTVPSPLSIVPSARILDVPGVGGTVAEVVEVSTGIPALDSGLNGYLSVHPYSGYVPAELAPDGPLPVIPEEGPTNGFDLPAIIWAAGCAVLLIYSAASLFLLRKRLVGATPLEGETGVWLADRLDTPFVLGLIRPRIYLPSTLGEGERGCVLLHERTHIRRLDQVTRALAWLALCIHWFDPLVWLAFRLAGRDMEVSCDESALRRSEVDIRTEYAASLLRLSAGRRLPVGPLAFGDGDPKYRIKNVLEHKRPALWAVAASLLAVLVAAVLLVTGRPFEKPESPFGAAYSLGEYVYMSQAGPGIDGTYELADPDILSVPTPSGGRTEIQLEPVSLRSSFDEYLRDENWLGGNTRSSLLRNNYSAWKAIVRSNESDDVFWYLLQQKDGTLYLASGWHDSEGDIDPLSDDSSFHWIARLEKAGD